MAASELLQNFPVDDLTIEEIPIEDVIRKVFRGELRNEMKKYWSIFKISFEQEFAYRLNFILWRVRNVFQILLTYFLWSTVFADPRRKFSATTGKKF